MPKFGQNDVVYSEAPKVNTTGSRFNKNDVPIEVAPLVRTEQQEASFDFLKPSTWTTKGFFNRLFSSDNSFTGAGLRIPTHEEEWSDLNKPITKEDKDKAFKSSQKETTNITKAPPSQSEVYNDFVKLIQTPESNSQAFSEIDIKRADDILGQLGVKKNTGNQLVGIPFSLEINNIEDKESYDRVLDFVQTQKEAKKKIISDKWDETISLAIFGDKQQDIKGLREAKRKEIESIDNQYNSFVSNIQGEQVSKLFNQTKPEESSPLYHFDNIKDEQEYAELTDSINQNLNQKVASLNSGAKDKELQKSFQETGAELQYLGNNKQRDVALANLNFGKEYGEIHQPLLQDDTKGISKLEQDLYEYQGWKFQKDNIKGLIKATEEGITSLIEKASQEEDQTARQKQVYVIEKTKENLLSLQKLEQSYEDYGNRHLSEFKEQLVKQEKINELGDKYPALATTRGLLKFVKEIPSSAAEFAEDLNIPGIIGQGFNETKPVSSNSSRTTNLADVLIAQTNTPTLEDIEAQVLDEDGNRIDLSQAEAIRLFKDGEWSPNISARPFFYQTGKQTIQSAILGVSGGMAESLAGTAIKGQIKKSLFGAALAEGAGFKTAATLYKTSIPLLQGAKVINRLGSMAVPSTLMFGDQMFDSYIKAGFTPNQSGILSLISGTIEGGTEAIFGNEIRLYKAFIGEAGTAIEKQEAKAIFNKAMAERILSRTGTPASDATLNFLQNLYTYGKRFGNSKVGQFSIDAVKTSLEETTEEEIGLLAKTFVENPLAQKYNPSYTPTETFNLENAFNIAIQTVATMLPMAGYSGYRNIKNQATEGLRAKYEVGSSPFLHLPLIQEQLKNNEITNEEAQRRIALVNDYSQKSDAVNHIVNNSPLYSKYTEDELDKIKVSFFESLLKKSELAKELQFSITDKQKSEILEEINKIDEGLNTILSEGLYKSDEERIKSRNNYLDYFFNPNTLSQFQDIEALFSVKKSLEKEQSKETDENLFKKYDEKLSLISDRVLTLRKEQGEKLTPENVKAQENNKQGSITYNRTNGKPFQLKFNTPYHLSTIEETSTTGSKIVKRPLITILSDNGDGTLTISSEGETSQIQKEDLKKYEFTEKSKVDELRNKGDISALFFDHENDVFNYTFSSETKDRDKAPVGRLKKEDGKYYFVYKDKKGNTKKQLIKKEDFSPQKGYTFPKLVFNKTLLTPEEAAFKEQQYNESVARTKLSQLNSQNERREQVISEFIKQETEKLTKTYDNKLKKLTEKLSKLSQAITYIKSIAKISNTKLSEKDLKTNLSKDTYSLIKFTGIELKPYDILIALQEQVKVLQLQASDIQNTITQIQSQRDQIASQIGEDWQELTEADYESERSLSEQVKEYRDTLKAQIQANTSLISKLKEVIEDILTKLSNFGDSLINITSYLNYNPLGSEENPEYVSETNQELKARLEAAEQEIKSLEQENTELKAEYKKVNKFYKFLSEKEEEFVQNRKKVNITKKKELIFKKQLEHQTSSKTGIPTEDKEQADKALGESSKFDIGEIFSITTSNKHLDEQGNITSPDVLRLQNFLNRVKDFTKFKLLVLTKDNAAKYGLSKAIFSGKGTTNEIDNEQDNDIILVVIDDSKEEIQFIDEFGEPLSKENVNENTIVQASIRKAKLKWESGEINHTIKGKAISNPEELSKKVEQAHREFRQEVVNSVKTLPEGHIITFDFQGVTRGSKNPALETPEAQPVTNILPANTDLTKDTIIIIPTVEKPVAKYEGQGKFINMPIGRPVLSFLQHFTFLNNRRFTTEEATKFVEIFQYLYDMFKEDGSLENIDNDVYNYLKKTTYFRIPSKESKVTGKAQDTLIGKSQIWFTYDNNQLYLNLGPTFRIPFQMEPNDNATRTTIEAFFNGDYEGHSAYHNVDAKDLLAPFTEVTDIIDGKIYKRFWDSYQEYLLSPTYPDGSIRPTSEIPLTINLLPSTPTAPNTVGRGVVYSNPVNDDVLSKEQYSTSSEQEDVVITQKPPSSKEETSFQKSPNQDLTKIPSYSKDKKQYRLEFIGTEGETAFIEFTVGEGNKSLVTSNSLQPGKDGNKLAKEHLDSLLSGKTKSEDAYILKEKVNKEVKPKSDTATFKPREITPTPPIQEEMEGEDFGITLIQKERDELEELKKKLLDKGRKKDKPDYRIAKKISYKFENLSKAKQWFEERFPQFEFKTILGLIDGIAWGQFKDNAIILSNLAEEGTVYHEAFEAVYKHFLNPRQISRLNQQFRNRKGTFIDRETDTAIYYSNATDFQIKEQIAEEYREYVLSDGIQKWEGESIKNSLFRRILNLITDFVFGTPDTIEEVFQKINDAKYKDSIPNLNLTKTTSYRVEKIKEEDPQFFNDIMQAITSIMFQGLQESNKPILSIFDSASNFNISQEYDRIKEKLDEYYGGSEALELLTLLNTPQKFISYFSNPANLQLLEGITSQLPLDELPEMSLPQLLTKVYDVLKAYERINQDWHEFKLEHQQYLRRYGIEFLEEDEEILDEDERTNEYIPNQLTLSRKTNARTEVKLLIATLKEMENKWVVTSEKLKQGYWKPQRKLNSILTANLVDYGQTINILLHKLTPSTTFEEMLEIIKQESASNPSLAPLYKKLTPEKETDFSVDLKNKFFQSLMNMRVEFDKLIINSNLSGATANLNEQRALQLTKEKWLNNLLNNKTLITATEAGKVLHKQNLKTKQITNETEASNFLKEIKFDFPILLSKLSREERSKFLDSVRTIFRVITTNSPDLLYTNAPQVREYFTNLAELYIKYTDSYAEPQHFNIEGKPVQNILQENFVGKIVKAFNAAISLEDFHKRIPQLNPNNPGNSFLKHSLINGIGKFFNAQGEKTQDISVQILDGSEVRDGNGIPTNKLSITDRIAQEFAYNLKGIYYLLTPADTKTEWGLKLGHFLSQSQVLDEETVLDTFRTYLIAEIATIQEGNPNNLAQLDKNDNKNQLRFFKSILKDVPLVITPKKLPEEIVLEKIAKIDKAILKWIAQDVDDTFNYFEKSGILTDYKAPEVSEDTEGFIASTGFTPTSIGSTNSFTIAFAPQSFVEGGLTKDKAKDLVRFANINYFIAMMEQHKLLWGDPAQWGDATKRIKSYVSGRNISVVGQYFDDYHNKKSNTKSFIDENGNIQTVQLEDGEMGFNLYNGKIRTQTLKDVEITSLYTNEIREAIGDQADDYEKVMETDGQGIAFSLGYREIKQRDNNWTEADEELQNWDDAEFRLDNNFYPEGERGELLRKHDQLLRDKGNPFLNRAKNNQELPIRNVLKPIYSGFKAGDSSVQNIDKLSLAYISWNLAKQFPGLKALYIEHYKKQTHYIKFASANKVGVQNNLQDFLNPEGVINPIPEQEELDFKYFGIQVETKTQKNKTSLGTQVTKQATLDLIDNGIPTSFTGTEEEWNNLSEEEKEKNDNYRLVNENNRVLTYMKVMATNTLFEEFGIQKVTKNRQNFYQLTNLEKLEELIQREFKNRLLPDNLVQFAKLNEDKSAFLLPFDLLIGGEKVENLLNSIIDKRILRPTLYGGQLPQIAVTLFNQGKRNLVYKKDNKWTEVENLENLSPEEAKTVRITSSELKFYQNEDGKRYCEIYLPFYMQEFISQGNTLNINDLPEELKFGVGFRIPTQGINSIEHFKIKGFLPMEYGNSIVLPSEITTKSGGDFDIDKLNVYLYNYYVKNNKPIKIEFDSRTSTEATQERYNKKYRKMVSFTNWFKSNEGYTTFKNSKSWEEFTSSNNFLEFISTIPEGKLTDILFSITDEESSKYTNFSRSYQENINSLEDLIKIEEETTPTFEEFSKLPIYLQNSKRALENKYIDTLREILQLPENYKALVEPNTAKVLVDLAKKVNNLYQKPSKDSKSATDYLSRLNNANTRHAFLVGKDSVSIAASHMSFHGIAQNPHVNLPFSVPYESPKDKIFNFKTNSKIVGDRLVYSMSHIYDSSKLRKISSTISAFINAFVDVAKDPFILDINGNYATASIYFTGLKLGIPIETLALWFTQPVILDYINETSKNKSILVNAQDKKLFKSQILEKLASNYGFVYDKLIGIKRLDRPKDYSEIELENYIKEFVQVEKGELSKYTQKFSENQGQLLKEFIHLEEIAWEVFNTQQGTNFDTKRTATNDMIRVAFAKVNKALATSFSDSVKNILTKTFVGVPFQAKFNFLQSQKDLYITESDVARSVLNPILIQLYQKQGLKADVIEKEARNLKRAFITYLIHTLPISINQQAPTTLTSLIPNLLKSDEDNIAKRLLRVQEAEQTNQIDPNFLLRNLQAILPKLLKSKIANVRLLRKLTDKLDSDMMTANWRNLRNHSNTSQFAYDLLSSALLQSGVRITPNSFQELIPNQLFTEITNQVFDYFFNNPTQARNLISNFQNSYYENNWQNRDLIPKARITTSGGKSRLNNQFLTKQALKQAGIEKPITFLRYFVESDSFGIKITREANNRYIFYSELKKDVDGSSLYSPREREQMAKKGDFSFLDQILFKRVEIFNTETNEYDSPMATDKYGNKYVLFYPVNKKGDGDNAVEHYSTPQKSQINSQNFPAYTDIQIFNALQASKSLTGDFFHQTYKPFTTQQELLSLESLEQEELQSPESLDVEELVNDLENIMESAEKQLPSQNKNMEEGDAQQLSGENTEKDKPEDNKGNEDFC